MRRINLRSLRHAFHTTGDHDAPLAKLDVLGGKHNSLHATGTDLVDGRRIRRLGDTTMHLIVSRFILSFFFLKQRNAPGTDTDLPGGRLPNTSLDDVTHIKLLDLLWLDTGLFDGVLDGDDTELRGGDGGEGAVLCADGGTGGGDDVHGVDLWDVDVSWRMHKRQAQRTIMRACLIFCDKRRREVRIVYTAENRGVQGGVLVREGRIEGFRKRESSGVIVCMRRIWDVHL